MRTRLGYIVTDDSPKDYIELLGTMVISEQGLVISGTWGGKTDWLSDLPSFELKHVSTVNIKLLGEFSFNGSFDYAGERVPEKCVNVLVSRIDKGALSIQGWGMNKLGVFIVDGEGESSNADGSEYTVSLRKTYILEDGSRTILWQMHSVNGGPSDLCGGEVISFDMKQTRVRVLFYKDGKFEWLSLEEAIDIATTPVPMTNVNLDPISIGAKISKHFLLQNGRSKQFLGRVTSQQPGDRYTIKFDDDGSEEEMKGDMVRHLLDCSERRELELVSTSRPARGNKVPPKTNAKTATASEVIELLDDDDDDSDCIDDPVNQTSGEVELIKHRLKVAECKLEVATLTMELNQAMQQKGGHKATESKKAPKVKAEDTVDLHASPSNQKRARVSL